MTTWINKYELAHRLGLVDEVGQPRTSGINRKCKSGEWPSHKVLGQLRFSPEDVAAIEEKLRHPATVERSAAPSPVRPRVRRRSVSPAADIASAGHGFADLADRPLRERRRAS